MMGILLLALQGGWKFFTGPVGRWVALALAVLALLAGVAAINCAERTALC